MDEFEDDENEITKVFAITRDEWTTLNKNKLDFGEIYGLQIRKDR